MSYTKCGRTIRVVVVVVSVPKVIVLAVSRERCVGPNSCRWRVDIHEGEGDQAHVGACGQGEGKG